MKTQGDKGRKKIKRVLFVGAVLRGKKKDIGRKARRQRGQALRFECSDHGTID